MNWNATRPKKRPLIVKQIKKRLNWSLSHACIDDCQRSAAIIRFIRQTDIHLHKLVPNRLIIWVCLCFALFAYQPSETRIKLNHFDSPTVINAPINEPPLPRRKKCPELAYRHHEFIADSSHDNTDFNVTRARVSVRRRICRGFWFIFVRC